MVFSIKITSSTSASFRVLPSGSVTCDVRARIVGRPATALGFQAGAVHVPAHHCLKDAQKTGTASAIRSTADGMENTSKSKPLP